MQPPLNGNPDAPLPSPEDLAADVFRDATATLRKLVDTFTRTASLLGLPKELTSLSGFQLAFQIVLMNNQAAFYNGVMHLLAELLERTKAEDGGLDPRSIQREIARGYRNMVMGPDPEILQRLIQGANHASAVQEGDMQEMREKLAAAQEFLEHVRWTGPLEMEDLKERAGILLESYKTSGTDPGSIPETTRIDGTTEPQL